MLAERAGTAAADAAGMPAASGQAAAAPASAGEAGATPASRAGPPPLAVHTSTTA